MSPEQKGKMESKYKIIKAEVAKEMLVMVPQLCILPAPFALSPAASQDAPCLYIAHLIREF